MKKKPEAPPSASPVCMSDVQYWEWRTRATLVMVEDLKVRVASERLKTAEAEQRAASLQVQVQASRVRDFQAQAAAARGEYQDHLTGLETVLGTKIRGCTIDEYRHAIVPLDEERRDPKHETTEEK